MRSFEGRSGRRKLWVRTLAVFGVLAVFCALHPDLTRALIDGNTDQIIQELRSEPGIRTVVFLCVLQVLQVFTIVFPGMPVHIASGILLGPAAGFAVCYFSFLAANAAVFLRLRCAGGTPEPALPDGAMKNEKVRSIVRRLTDTSNGTVRIVMVSILPFFPNGIIPYYAASTKMRGRDFMAGVAIGSPFPIISDCLAGHLFVNGHPVLAILICAMLFGAAALIGFNQEKLTVPTGKPVGF